MKAPSWALRRSPHSARTASGSWRRGHDAGQDGVLPVVADVGDAVGPAHHLALGGRRRRARPAVVARSRRAVSAAQVERSEGDVGAPRRVVEPTGQVGVERVLAGVAARPVAAVVAEGDRLGEGHVQPAGPGDGRGDLGHLERVGEPGALVVLRGRRRPGSCRPAGGTTSECRMRSRSRSKQVRQASGCSGSVRVAGVGGPRRSRRQQRVLELPGAPIVPAAPAVEPGPGGPTRGAGPDAGARVGVGQADGPGIARHGRCPAGTALRLPGRGRAVHVQQSAPSQ